MWLFAATGGMKVAMKHLLVAFALLATGCAQLAQLDAWSRGTKRYVDPAEMGPDGIPNQPRKHFINKFILWSEVPVSEFYGKPYYTSRN